MSSGLDDFFIPADDREIPDLAAAPTAAQADTAPRGIHAPSVPGVNPPGPVAQQPAPQPAPAAPEAGMPAPVPPAVAAPVAPATPAPTMAAPSAPAPSPTLPEPASAPSAPRQPSRTREQQLSAALATFMRVSADVEAAALVSLDGFIMASALPEGMHEDRVGAMSAAILGLGERAAVELGRGRLTQVFIEGDSGYVLLMAAGDRAVLTALAHLEAKLGLLLYDMRDVAEAIADILG